MIRFLRHISIRMFISALIWMPLSFIFLTQFGYANHGNNSFAAALILFIIFFAVGFLMNETGKKLILKFVKEAKSWEQAGIYKKSEEKYIKALRIYDSFLLSPLKSRKITKILTGAIAKFSLGCSIQNPVFNSAVTSFLSMFPNDTDLALLWLERLCSNSSHEPCVKEKEILASLAEIHFDNPEIVILIADIFTRLNYCDFTAHKIYKKALKLPDLNQNTRTAIKEYLKKENKKFSEKLASHTVSKEIIVEESVILSDIRVDGEARKGGNGKKTGVSTKNMAINFTLNKVNGIFKWIWGILKKIFIMMNSSFKYSFDALSKLSNAQLKSTQETASYIKKTKKIKTIVRLSISAILCIGIIIFITNTYSRFFYEKTPEPEKKYEIQQNLHKTKSIGSDSFTIQVAAYLKKKYGDAYVAKLKAKGLDAYLSQTEGGGKTWFTVRISQFPDKKAAAEYGKKLKTRGYIDDFFVDNNSRRQ